MLIVTLSFLIEYFTHSKLYLLCSLNPLSFLVNIRVRNTEGKEKRYQCEDSDTELTYGS